MLGLFSSALPIMIRILGMMLDKSKANAETHQKYLDFVEAASMSFDKSASIKQSLKAQKERLAKAREEMKNGNQTEKQASN